MCTQCTQTSRGSKVSTKHQNRKKIDTQKGHIWITTLETLSMSNVGIKTNPNYLPHNTTTYRTSTRGETRHGWSGWWIDSTERPSPTTTNLVN